MSGLSFDWRDRVNLVSGAALLACLTGCVGDMPHRGAWVASPPSEQVPGVASLPDDYLYYPNYEIYYSRNGHGYVYLESDGWVIRPVPAQVSADVLHASPAVAMDFHDAPPLHHDSVIRSYPKTWPVPAVTLAAVSGAPAWSMTR